jgi:anti-sigma factor RsiW
MAGDEGDHAGYGDEGDLARYSEHGEYGDLAGYLIGAMSGLDADDIEEHLARCPGCARELEHLVWVSELLARAAAAFEGLTTAEPYPGGPVTAGPPCALVGRAPGAGLSGRGQRIPARVRAGRAQPTRCG